MSRLSAIEEPVGLTQLLKQDELAQIAQSCADLHSVGVHIIGVDGRPVVECGPAVGDDAVRANVYHEGELLARVLVGGGTLPADRREAVARHVVTVLGPLVHTAYARHLTAIVHTAVVEDQFAELTEKNRRLEEALERLRDIDRLKSNFLATISHELRTPLTSVIGYAEMLLEGMAGEVSTDQVEYLNTILAKADQLLQLITGILDVSTVQANAVKIKCEPLSVSELITGVVAGMVPQAIRRGVALGLPAAGVPNVLGDRRKIRQVLIHLVANAIKFSPRGGNVEIETYVGSLSPDDHATFGSPLWAHQLDSRFGIRVSVKDAGIGIESEKLSEIFEPFYQVDSSSTREFGGVGLGLSLAKSYVEAHGGSIWVNSQPGAGSTFTLSLPAVPEELAAFARDAAPAPE